MEMLFIGLLIWFLLSIPVALLVGRALRRLERKEPRAEGSEESQDA